MGRVMEPPDRHNQDPTLPYLQMQIYMQTAKLNLTSQETKPYFPNNKTNCFLLRTITKKIDFHNKK